MGILERSSRSINHYVGFSIEQDEEIPGTLFLTEIRAGITTFFTMAYIIAVNVSSTENSKVVCRPENHGAQIISHTAVGLLFLRLLLSPRAEEPVCAQIVWTQHARRTSITIYVCKSSTETSLPPLQPLPV
jgi:hypothetical protein